MNRFDIGAALLAQLRSQWLDRSAIVFSALQSVNRDVINPTRSSTKVHSLRMLGIREEGDKAMEKSDHDVQNAPIVQEAVRRILGASAPDRIIVFGSRARGDARRDSDLDLLVVLPRIESRREARIALRIALTGLGVPKDVMVATLDDIRTRGQHPGSVLRTALEEGIIVYERAA